MTTFRFLSAVYDVPQDVDIEVIEIQHGPLFEGDVAEYVIDFNFFRDGVLIPLLGGTDEHGNRLPTWEEIGVRRVLT